MTDRLGPFEVLQEQAGSGATRIWRCAGEEGGTVVVEQLLPPLSRSQRFTEAVLEAARACEGAGHSNLAPVIWTQPIDGVPTLAERRSPGHDLRAVYNQAYRQQASLPLAFSTRVLADAALGFGAAGRAHTLCHGGVAPQQIWVTREGYGVAIHVPRACLINRAFFARPEGPLQGSYTYASPEQLHGRAPTARTDVFALGIVLYEMTTGARLFKRRTAEEARAAVLACKVEAPTTILPGYPPALERIVLKALQRQPKDRWEGPEQMAGALERDVLKDMGDARSVVRRFVERLFPDTGTAPARRAPDSRGSDRPAVRIVSRDAAPPSSPPPPQTTRARPAPERRSELEDPTASEPPASPPPTQHPRGGPLQTTGAMSSPLREAQESPAEVRSDELAHDGELPTEIQGAPPSHRPEPSSAPTPAEAGPVEDAPPIWTPEEAELAKEPNLRRPGGRRLAVALGLLLLGGAGVWASQRGWIPSEAARLAGGPEAEPAAEAVDSPAGAPPGPPEEGSSSPLPDDEAPEPAAEGPPGRLALWVEPWAEVSLDGRDLGLTPLPEAKITAGEHRLEVVNAELRLKWAGKFEVKPGTTTRLHLDLRAPEARRLSYGPVEGEAAGPPRGR